MKFYVFIIILSLSIRNLFTTSRYVFTVQFKNFYFTKNSIWISIFMTEWNCRNKIICFFSIFLATSLDTTVHLFTSIFNLQSSLTNFYSFYYKILMPFPQLLLPFSLSLSVPISRQAQKISYRIYLMDKKKSFQNWNFLSISTLTKLYFPSYRA